MVCSEDSLQRSANSYGISDTHQISKAVQKSDILQKTPQHQKSAGKIHDEIHHFDSIISGPQPELMHMVKVHSHCIDQVITV